MNNRRKEDRREAGAYALANPLPEIARPHRECELECLTLKSRVKQLEGLLARCGEEFLRIHNRDMGYTEEMLIAEIDAILPATEDKKDG